jgi:hypothetical protein
MAIKLTDAAWLARETERAKGILLQHMVKGQEYTVAELLELLATYGLTYSNPEYTGIGANLIADGTLETT